MKTKETRGRNLLIEVISRVVIGDDVAEFLDGEPTCNVGKLILEFKDGVMLELLLS